MNSWLQSWVPFLFGTPKRTLVTVAVMFAVLLVVIPSLAAIIVTQIMIALTPFIQLALLLGVLWVGYKYVTKKESSGKKKK